MRAASATPTTSAAAGGRRRRGAAPAAATSPSSPSSSTRAPTPCRGPPGAHSMARAAATVAAPHWPVGPRRQAAGPAAVGAMSAPSRRPVVACAAASAPDQQQQQQQRGGGDAGGGRDTTNNNNSVSSGATAAAAAAGTDGNIDDLIAWFAERRRQDKASNTSSSGGGGGAGARPAGAASSSAAATGASAEQEDDDPGYMREYARLKAEILDSTRRCGGGMAAYALLTAGGAAALCVLVGAAASSAYVSLLVRDVDSVRPTDAVPIWEANRIGSPFLRRLAKIAASYRAALRPRLLVPASLALGVAAYNAASPDSPLPLVDEGCVLAGFLAYKVALLIKVADAQWPAARRGGTAPGAAAGAYRDMVGGGDGDGDEAPSGRPTLEPIEDDLDIWGRPKKSLLTMPTEALPPEQRRKAEEQLAEDARKERRRNGEGDGGGGGAAPPAA